MRSDKESIWFLEVLCWVSGLDCGDAVNLSQIRNAQVALSKNNIILLPVMIASVLRLQISIDGNRFAIKPVEACNTGDFFTGI